MPLMPQRPLFPPVGCQRDAVEFDFRQPARRVKTRLSLQRPLFPLQRPLFPYFSPLA